MEKFLPDSLEGWLAVIVIVGGAIFTVSKAYSALITKINGLGTRTGVLETDVTTLKASSAGQGRELEFLRMAVTSVQVDIGAIKQGVAGTNDHITEMKMEIMGALSELKTGALKEEAKVRERIVRLETVSELERKLGRPLHELMDQ